MNTLNLLFSASLHFCSSEKEILRSSLLFAQVLVHLSEVCCHVTEYLWDNWFPNKGGPQSNDQPQHKASVFHQLGKKEFKMECCVSLQNLPRFCKKCFPPGDVCVAECSRHRRTFLLSLLVQVNSICCSSDLSP